MLIGLFLSSLGVSFSIKAGLGATPVGVCPAVFSPYFKISTGMGMAILLGLFFLTQIVILKREFKPSYFMQLAVTVIYGLFVDLTANIVTIFPEGIFWAQILYCGLGIVTLGLGVFTMLKANFLMLPQDALVKVISVRYNKEYGKVKIVFDSLLTVIAAIGSWVLYQKFIQVGIGTIVAAIFVGKIISGLKEFKGLNHFLDRIIIKSGQLVKYEGIVNMELPKMISLLYRKMNMELNERLMKIGLSNAQSRLLKLLYINGGMTQAALCEELGMDKSTVAKALIPLIKNDFVTKTVNPEDARSFLVFPTQKAIEMIPKTLEIISGWTKDVTSGITEYEKELFYKMLHKVTQQAVAICKNSKYKDGCAYQ
jgi:uncharacterized membrane protein YczE/DNA-binding MarR family transcriptional regulator